METVYLCFVIFLFALAVFDLMVGVSNDAVNFLNSAIGAKAAPFRTVIIIAAIGVFCGAAMSNGMMEIARHGIFRPEHFFFEDLMWIFLGVMVTDIVLLDIFNSLGMPTSTTVSMVFELLGGIVVAIALVAVAVVLLIRSNLSYRKKAKQDESETLGIRLMRTRDRQEAWQLLSAYVTENEEKCVERAQLIYRQITDGFFNQNLRELRRANTNVEWNKREHKRLRRREMVGLRKIEPSLAIEKNTWYHLGQNSCMQLNYCLTRMVEPCREHVDNNFAPPTDAQRMEFIPMRNKVLELLFKTQDLLDKHRYRDADALRAECDRVKEEISLNRKRQLDRMQNDDELLSTAYVYLSLLQESQELISAARHLLRAAKNFQTNDNVNLKE